MDEPTTSEKLFKAVAEVEDLSAKLKEATDQGNAAKAKLAEATATIESLTKSLADSDAAKVAADAKLAELVAEHSDTKDALKLATDRLALAAFADVGGTKPVTDGGESVQEKSKADLLKEYAAIGDAKAREQFRNQHPKILEP